MAQTEVKEYWDRKYRENGKIYGTFPSQSAYDLIRFILEQRKTGTKLDDIAVLGDGYGRNALYFAFMHLNPSIIEISEEAIELANAKTTESGLELRTKQADLLSWQPAENYDLAFSNFVIHLFNKEERARIYENARKALRPGGYFCGSFLSINDDDYALFAKTKSLEERTFLVRGVPQHFFLKEEISQELTDAGFYVLDILENKDPETIVDITRNTTYYFVIAKSRGNQNGNQI